MSAPFEPFDDFEELGAEQEECAAPVPWSVPCRRYVSLTDTAGREDYWHSHEVDLFPLVPFTGAKKDLACLVFATLLGQRCVANVKSVTAIAIDVDEWPGTVESFAITVANLRKCCAWYTTFSATEESPRFRIVFAMSRPLSPAEYPVFWRIVVRVLGRSGLKGIDESCKDCSRAWFVPAVPPSGFYVADQAEGDALNVDAVLSMDARLKGHARRAVPRHKPLAKASEAIRRARAYLSSMPAAISGQHGHDAAFRVAQVLVRKFGLADVDAMPLFLEWNARCEPLWSEKDLLRKLREARTQGRMPEGVSERSGA